MIKLYLIFILAFGLFHISCNSCNKRKDVVSAVKLPTILSFSQYTPMEVDGVTVNYEILVTGDQVSHAIFSDGSHLVVSHSSTGDVTLKDTESNEEWQINLQQGQQVIVRADRVIENVEKPISCVNGELKFPDSNQSILEAAAVLEAN